MNVNLLSLLTRIGPVLAAGASLVMAGFASAQPASMIFTCVNAKGQNLRSDRPIAECTDREQRILSREGTLIRILPPTLTAEERAAKEARERQLAAEKVAQKEAERADRLLMQRYPNEAAHDKSRSAALDRARDLLAESQARLIQLAAERKPLLTESEFYPNKPLPPKLKQELDAIEAATAAQRMLVISQQAEIVRISALYDAELARLRKLWSGAVPGTLGPIAPVQTASAPVKSTAEK